jgi:hypothetical protein
MFYMALASGWTLPDAVKAFGDIGAGWYNHTGKVFVTEHGKNRPGGGGEWWSLQFPDSEHAYNIHAHAGRVLCVEGWNDMRPGLDMTAGLTRVTSTRQGKPRFSRFLPEYVRLPRDAAGAVEYPQHGAAYVVEAEEAWHRLLGPLDRTTAAVVGGRLTIPRDAWPEEPSHLPNQASWENDPDAQAALGPEIAKYIHRGVFQYVRPDTPSPPIIISPMSAVDKATDPFYRLVQDARKANTGAAPWPTRYGSIADLRLLVEYADIMFAEDYKSAYQHLLRALRAADGGLFSRGRG